MGLKQAVISSILFLSCFSGVYATDGRSTGEGFLNIPQVNNLGTGASEVKLDFDSIKSTGNSSTSIESTNSTGQTTITSTVPTVSIKSGIVSDPFCNINSTAGLSDKYRVDKVSEREEKYIVLTYLGTYGKGFMEKINKDRTDDKKLTRYDILESQLLKTQAQKDCYEFRNKAPENHDIMNNLYKQVHFYSTYYSNYPDRLTEGITPGFLIFGIDLVDTLSTYLMLLTTLNIVVWSVLYMVGPLDKKEEFWKSVVNGFWYFLIVAAIKLGVLGSLIAFIGYEGLDFIKIFLI